MTTPFITPEDEYAAQSKSPLVIGQTKLNTLAFNMNMTDEQIDAVAEQAKQVRNTYLDWEDFYNDLRQRKLRLAGFQAVVQGLDLVQTAAALETTPELLSSVMQARAAAEFARIAELDQMWSAGTLPDVPVLSDPPVASFLMDKLTGTAPVAVTFNDTSTNNPVSWSWTFGDGGTSSVKNPMHTYTTPGTYTVTLIVTNAGGSATTTGSITVNSLLGGLTGGLL